MRLDNLTPEDLHTVWQDRADLYQRVIRRPDRPIVPAEFINMIAEWAREPVLESDRRLTAAADPVPPGFVDRVVAAVQADIGATK